MATAALGEVPGVNARPILDDRFHDDHADKTNHLNNIWKMLAVLLAITAARLVYLSIKKVIKHLRSQSILSFLPSQSAVSTVVVALSSETDRVIVPMITLPLPPSVFSLKQNNPRSIQMQNQCCVSRLIIDWGTPTSILFQNSMPVSLPSMLNVPMTRSRRVFNIISSPMSLLYIYIMMTLSMLLTVFNNKTRTRNIN